MYTYDDVRNRCRVVFTSAVDRHKKKLEKSAGKGVKLEIKSSEVLPYSFDQFLGWVWKTYGVGVHTCPWCGRPIDFRTMQFDHKIPIQRNGSLALSNQQGICKECNELKGEQTPEEFTDLLGFLGTLTNYHRNYLEQRIRAGAAANRMRFFPHVKKGESKPEGAPSSPKASAIQKRLNMDSGPPLF